jgi:hypothetical protein
VGHEILLPDTDSYGGAVLHANIHEYHRRFVKRADWHGKGPVVEPQENVSG